MFCQNCKSLLRLDEAGKCQSCGTKIDKGLRFSETSENKKATTEVGKEVETLTIIKKACPKCNNPEAFFWSKLISFSDEPETEFYKCTKCKHTWRVYR